MAPARRRPVISRRRHDDDGEEGESIVDEVEGYSSSANSVDTDQDEEDAESVLSPEVDPTLSVGSSPVLAKQIVSQDESASKQETPTHSRIPPDVQPMSSSPPSTSRRETEEAKPTVALQEGIDNPEVAIPTQPAQHHTRMNRIRGSAKRQEQRQNNNRGINRNFGNGSSMRSAHAGPSSSTQPWTHDLHETLNLSFEATPTNNLENKPFKPMMNGERSFSTTTVVGNVNVQVSMPESQEKKMIQNMVKKHYTLLPTHRPPMRRDKPVRIAIPDTEPRFAFPSVDRSFIFIPRALRPNQQVSRGRGRGSLHGSARQSTYAGSVYTPSMARSRKSSVAPSMLHSGARTPTNGQAYGADTSRPITDFESLHHASSMQSQMADTAAMESNRYQVPSEGMMQATENNGRAHSQTTHQQIPTNTQSSSMSRLHYTTQIPEAAVHAQPFQPHTTAEQSYYYAPYDQMQMMTQQNNVSYGDLNATAIPYPDYQGFMGIDGMMYYYDPSMNQPTHYAHTSMHGQVYYQ